MIIGAVGVFADLKSVGSLRLLRVVIQQQGDHAFRAFDKLRWVKAFVEMIFHVLHPAMPAFVEPLLQPWGFFLKETGPADATGHEAKPLGFGFYQGGMFFSV